MQSKFKVGDKVEVVDDGYGFSFEEIGSVVTIKEVDFGAYLQDEFGYRIEECTGNNLIGKFDGWHGERSFRLVVSANHEPIGAVPPDVVALGDEFVSTQHVENTSKNKYTREIKPSVFVDVYDVLRAFNVTDPCLSHLAKKALCAGLRGHKDRLEDLKDIKKSIERAIEMHKEWNK